MLSLSPEDKNKYRVNVTSITHGISVPGSVAIIISLWVSERTGVAEWFEQKNFES